MFLKPKKPVDMPVCKYASACSRKDCVFRHPPAKKAPESDPQAAEVCMPFLADMCAFGSDCHNKHPSPSECEKIRAGFLTKWCRFGSTCKTKGCLYRHPNPTALLDLEPKRPAAPTILATGPVYRHTSPTPPLSPKYEVVPIPIGIYVNYDEAIASHAFAIKDPIERFGYVNSQHSQFAFHSDEWFVLDLHFQSTRSVQLVLEQVIPQCLEYLETCQDKEIWLITGAGNHVPIKSHQVQGGVLFDAVLEACLGAKHDLCVRAGVDTKGNKSAVCIRKK